MSLFILNPASLKIKGNILQIVLILTFILFSYSIYFGLDRETAIRLALEDNLFETLTALFFLTTSFFLAKSYLASKNLYFFFLTIIFLFGAGEEISWGQRYLGFHTPEVMEKRNRQNEFNLHNIDIFHPQNEKGISKTGLEKLLSIDFLYNLFWLSWCVIVPVMSYYFNYFSLLFKKVKLPVPSLIIGVFFPFNFFVFFILRSFTSSDKSDLFYMRFREIFECSTSLIFLMIAWSFYLEEKVRDHQKR